MVKLWWSLTFGAWNCFCCAFVFRQCSPLLWCIQKPSNIWWKLKVIAIGFARMGSMLTGTICFFHIRRGLVMVNQNRSEVKPCRKAGCMVRYRVFIARLKHPLEAEPERCWRNAARCWMNDIIFGGEGCLRLVFISNSPWQKKKPVLTQSPFLTWSSVEPWATTTVDQRRRFRTKLFVHRPRGLQD